MKVLVIGGGIAGPVLAMLLQHVGHEPILYERHSEPSPGGITLQLSPQTFKVLKILGLDEKALALGKPIERLVYRSEVSGKTLFQTDDIGARLRAGMGWPLCNVDRPAYTRLLLEEAQARGIKVGFGRRLVDVRQTGEEVTAVFEDGSEEGGELLVGCDGLHSPVRDAVFGLVEPQYTGVIAVAGTSTIPPHMDASLGRQVFGDGGHFFCVQHRADQVAWGCTLPEPDESGAKEDWRTAGPEQVQALLASLPQAEWSGEVGEVLRRAVRVVKFGLYLRPILPVWHKGRVVLCGDAAHPTAPYLGQGANQSMEDCYHLVRLLPKHPRPTVGQLDEGFTEYSQLRLPRVTAAVEQAQREGAFRTMRGRDACLKRDAMLAKGLESGSWKVVLEMVQGPYEGESAI